MHGNQPAQTRSGLITPHVWERLDRYRYIACTVLIIAFITLIYCAYVYTNCENGFFRSPSANVNHPSSASILLYLYCAVISMVDLLLPPHSTTFAVHEIVSLCYHVLVHSIVSTVPKVSVRLFVFLSSYPTLFSFHTCAHTTHTSFNTIFLHPYFMWWLQFDCQHNYHTGLSRLWSSTCSVCICDLAVRHTRSTQVCPLHHRL